MWAMKVLMRTVDDRGRVVLPIRGKRKVFIAKWDDIIIIAPSKNRAEEIVKQLDDIKRRKMLEFLNEWFNIVEESGLDKFTAKDLDKILTRSMLREVK